MLVKGVILMPKKISIIEKRKWLEEYESGKSESEIASGKSRDTRTVKKALDDARRDRDARYARSELMKEALRNHQDALKKELMGLIRSLESHRDDFVPLSWNQGVKSIFTWAGRVEDLGYIPGISAGRRSSTVRATSTAVDLLRQHLKDDKSRRILVQWEKACITHIAARVSLQKKVIAMLRQKTGYGVFDRPPESPPYLFSYTAGSILYHDIIGLALDLHTKSDLEKDTVTDSRDGTVTYHNSILARAPGDESSCRDRIFEAHRELLKSEECRLVGSSYRELDKAAVKARQAAEDIVLLGYIPGQCRVCRRLGM
jgi:hypothetical protein